MDYIKLSEVTLLETVDTEPNVLAEVDGEVVRIPASEVSAPQVKADWDEEDPNSPAYILNKPEIPEGSGGGVEVRYYTPGSGSITENETGAVLTKRDIIDAWANGVIMRIGTPNNSGNIVRLKYTEISGSIGTVNLFYTNDAGTIEKFSF